MENLLIRFIKRYISHKKDPHELSGMSSYRMAKEIRAIKVESAAGIKDVLLIMAGILSAAFGLKSFLLPNQFIDGGAMGIALLISGISNFHLALILVLVNTPFIILGYRIINPQFAFKTAGAILALSIVMATVHFPGLTQEKMLVSVFGGFFLGTGIGLSMRGGAVIDGTEVLALYLSRKWGTTVGDIIALLNIVIFSVAAYLLSIETAMYSMITYLAASKSVDFVIEGIEEYTGITIISPHSEEIRLMIIQKLGRGVTVYKGKRGFGSHGHRDDIDIVFTVITRLEISKINDEIAIIDPNAFVVMHSIKDTRGGMVKKRPLAH